MSSSVADPNGDVDFLVGPKEKALKVSSKVLSLASNVFAALFSPKYSEGIALSKSREVRQIKLLDDDPEALGLVCCALHYRPTTPHEISLHQLKQVAAVCDKYDLAQALIPWSSLWLQGWLRDAEDECDWLETVCISSVLENRQAFYISSEKLLALCSTTQPIITSSRKALTTSLATSLHEEKISWIMETAIFSIAGIPERLFAGIRARSEALRRGVLQAIEGPVSYALHDDVGDKEVSHLMARFWMADLWPVSKVLSLDLQRNLLNLKGFRHCDGTKDCECDDLSVNIDIEDIIKFLEGQLKGLCLECVRAGKVTVEEGNCSQPQEHLRKG